MELLIENRGSQRNNKLFHELHQRIYGEISSTQQLARQSNTQIRWRVLTQIHALKQYTDENQQYEEDRVDLYEGESLLQTDPIIWVSDGVLFRRENYYTEVEIAQRYHTKVKVCQNCE